MNIPVLTKENCDNGIAFEINVYNCEELTVAVRCSGEGSEFSKLEILSFSFTAFDG